MFKRYYLVELVACNQVKSVRSNCIVEGRMFGLPPLDKVYQNCVEIGYPSLNILSVTRVSRKCAEVIKKHINGVETYNSKTTENLVKKVMNSEDSTGHGEAAKWCTLT